MAKVEIIIPLNLLTATYDMLRKLQQIYPANAVINHVLDIFEILTFYEKNIKGEDRIAVAESCINILEELAHITKTLEPYLDHDKQVFSEDERNKLENLLYIDAHSILKLVKEHKKDIRIVELHLLNEVYDPVTAKPLSMDGVILAGTRTQLGLIVECLKRITHTEDLEVIEDDVNILTICVKALDKSREQSDEPILCDPDNPIQ